MGAQAAAALE
jgi:calmodulin